MAQSTVAAPKTFPLKFYEPMECLLVSKLPEGAQWSYEVKLDGYRAQAICDGVDVRLLSRTDEGPNRLLRLRSAPARRRGHLEAAAGRAPRPAEDVTPRHRPGTASRKSPAAGASGQS